MDPTDGNSSPGGGPVTAEGSPKTLGIRCHRNGERLATMAACINGMVMVGHVTL